MPIFRRTTVEATRIAAAEAPGEIGDSQAVEPLLISWLKDDNWHVHYAATIALMDIDEPAVDPLISASRHRLYPISTLITCSASVEIREDQAFFQPTRYQSKQHLPSLRPAGS